MIKPKKTLEGILPYKIDEDYGDYTLKLDSNENPYGASLKVIEALKSFNERRISIYPAYGKLKNKLAEIYGANADNFILTNGCDEAINVFFNTYLEENDEVLSFSPTFSMPELYANIIGAKFVKIPFEDDFKFDLSEYVKHITDKTKILYITSPNNPTGTFVDLEDVITLAKKHEDKIVFLDLTYFNYAECELSAYFNLYKQYKNIVVARSFSKDYALAGLRIGYIVADISITSEISKVISPYSVNAVAAHLAYEALLDEEYFLSVKDKITKSKDLLCKELNSLGFKTRNTKANFILCDFKDKADFIFRKLLSCGIKVKYFKNIEKLENTFRITAPKLEDASVFLSALLKRPLFVFDMDGVLFDVSNSYRLAIKKTVEHFTGMIPNDEEIQEIKNNGGMSNDWDVTDVLIKKYGKSADYQDLVNVFQSLFFNKNNPESPGLIDNEKNVFSKEFFKELIKYADCAIFTGRPYEEAIHSLKKYDIDKYFSYFICNEDVEGNYKPSPFGLNKIKEKCLYSKILYFGDTVDDIKAGIDANVNVYGIIPPNAKKIEETKSALLNFGACGVLTSPKDVLELAKKESYENNRKNKEYERNANFSEV